MQIPESCVVYTPPKLAGAMVDAIGDDGNATWLEPCVGGGVFVDALLSRGIKSQRIRALDASTQELPSDRFARTLRGTDFLRWSLGTRERFSRIVANPPFLSLSRIEATIRRAALEIPIPGGGLVPLGANTWFAFLCASVRLLSTRGRLCFVLPAAWEFADYAAGLRATLPSLFDQIDVHRCKEPLFESVQDGSVVLVAQGLRKTAQRNGTSPGISRFYRYESRDALVNSLRTPNPNAGSVATDVHSTTNIERATAPASAPQQVQMLSQSRSDASKAKTIGDVLEIRLGGVTGDTKFFVLSEADRLRLGLTTAMLRPVVARAHHLGAAELTRARWRALRNGGERVWLLDPPPRLKNAKALREYLGLERDNGGCDRQALKVRSRDPWYITPLPDRIDGFMSGMSSWGPWVVFRRVPRLAATNTLYVISFRERMSANAQAAWALGLLTTRAREHLLRCGRQYAAGLMKFEPSDIKSVPVSTPVRIDGALAAYRRAVMALLSGREHAARKLADQWFA